MSNKIDSLIRGYVENAEISGGAMIVRKDGQIVLHPENEALADMIYSADQVSILGKVVGLMRNYRS